MLLTSQTHLALRTEGIKSCAPCKCSRYESNLNTINLKPYSSDMARSSIFHNIFRVFTQVNSEKRIYTGLSHLGDETRRSRTQIKNNRYPLTTRHKVPDTPSTAYILGSDSGQPGLHGSQDCFPRLRLLGDEPFRL